MLPLVVIIGLTAAPVLIGLLLRVQPSLLFVSILAGYVLALFLTDDTSVAIGMLAPHVHVGQFIQIILLALPVVLTLVLARKSANQKWLVLQPIILTACGLLFAVLMQPFLPTGLRAKINSTPVGTNLERAQHVVVAVAILVNLVFMWLSSRVHQEPSHGHKRHH